jgi:hypothetical protein
MADLTVKKASQRYDGVMAHKALRMKAAHTDHSLSKSVNASVRRALAEDAEDLGTFERRAKEPNLSFEEVLKDMKRRGRR